MDKTILVCAVSSCLMAFANAAEYKLNTDVLVIGAGSAGLTAAVQSAEKGKKVILLEKNPMVGGSSQFAEGLFCRRIRTKSSQKRHLDTGRSIQNLDGKALLRY